MQYTLTSDQLIQIKLALEESRTAVIQLTEAYYSGARISTIAAECSATSAKLALTCLEEAEKNSQPTPAIASIENALHAYHHALDTRQHGGIAQDKLAKAVEAALNRPWIQGATLPA